MTATETASTEVGNQAERIGERDGSGYLLQVQGTGKEQIDVPMGGGLPPHLPNQNLAAEEGTYDTGMVDGWTTYTEITVEEEIWRLTEHEETGSSIMCESVAEREYEGSQLIRSLAILLGKSKIENDILISYLSRKRMAYEHIQRMECGRDFLKIQIYESRSETTEPKARVMVRLIANDGKMECRNTHSLPLKICK